MNTPVTGKNINQGFQNFEDLTLTNPFHLFIDYIIMF